ncbi:MAG: acylphosphatase [Candidatus Eisenbacteria bacterium]|nr:acylphosphatase [Candidatus Eisenbacteria bacterium]
MPSVRIVVTGRVQGVGYRAFAASEARPRGIAGEVRNLADGSVEVLAHGRRQALDEYIEVLRTGPRMARVADTVVEWFERADVPGDFRITG